ncbi:flavodoxin family protein [Tissierella creatinini]|nr:flavodoxin family protein [Tissierella creatinini]TJX64443.1 flavodoxin family protein [Soehngenia saccharolytica]
MKKVLAIMGSPRRNKNTEKLLDFLLDGIKELNYDINKIIVKELDIHSCTGCDHCGRTSECVFKDGMDLLYEGFDTSDIVIFAAPLYFNSINGLSKNIVDRCQKYWSIKYTIGDNYMRGKDRKGIFLSVGGAPYTHNHFSGTLPVMDFFFRAINCDYKVNYLVSNTDKNPIVDNVNIKNELFQIGKNIDNNESFYLHR